MTSNLYSESVDLYIESTSVQHVSYVDASADCYYAKQSSGVWTYEKVEADLADESYCDRFQGSSIALHSGIPFIFFTTSLDDLYIAMRNSGLTYQSSDDPDWYYQKFYDSGDNMSPTVEAKSDGNLGVSWISSMNVQYAYENFGASGSCSINNWTCENVTPGFFGQKLLFDENNIPVIVAYYSSKIKVAIRDGAGSGTCANTQWNCYTIDDADSIPRGNQAGVALNSNNNIGIAYVQSDKLMYAYEDASATTPSNGCDINGWVCQTVSASPAYDYPVDLTYLEESPLIIAQDDTSDQLEFFYYDEGWNNDTLGEFGFNEYGAIDNIGPYVGVAYYVTSGTYPYTMLAYDDTTIPTNTAPTVITRPAFLPPQATDGTGYVTLIVGISDTDGDDTKLKIAYSENGMIWNQAYIVSPATASYGSAPNVNNTYSGDTYQIGDTTGISTASGENTVTFVWDTQYAADGFTPVSGQVDTIQIRVTPNDGTEDGGNADSPAFTVDNEAPTSGTVSIQSGASYVTSASADLTLSATGADYMAFSNNGSAFSTYEAYATTRSAWDITSATYGGTSTDGTKTVYVIYKDASGNESTAVSDNIVYDTTSPTNPTSAIDFEGAVSDTWQNNKYDPIFISFTGESDTNGIQGFYVYFGTDIAGTTTDWTITDNDNPDSFYGTSGTRYLRVIAEDYAGLWADPDGAGETCTNTNASRAADSDCWATIFIHKYELGAPNTPSPAVAPTSWTNVNSFVFTWSDPGDTDSGVYDYTYETDAGTLATNTSDLSATLTSDSDGTKLFQIHANDTAGNSGSTGSVNFYYDATPPTNAGTVTDNSGSFDNTYGTVSDPDFIWTTGSDDSSGVEEYDVYWGTESTGETVTATTATNAYNPATLTEANIPYYLRINTRDDAGNESGWETKYTFKYSQIPDDPTLLAQTANDLTLSMGSWTNDTTPTLSLVLSDPDIDTLGYEIGIDDNSDFSSLIVDYLYGANDIVSGTTKSFTVGQAIETGASYVTGTAGQTLSEGSYYWIARAVESHGLLSSSAIANSGGIAFKIDTTGPDISAISFGSSSTSSSVTVSVSGVTDALSGLAAAPYYFENLTAGTNSGWQTSSTWSSSGLTAGTSYSFKVTILDAAGNTQESTTSAQTAAVGGAPLGLSTSSSSSSNTNTTTTNTTATDTATADTATTNTTTTDTATADTTDSSIDTQAAADKAAMEKATNAASETAKEIIASSDEKEDIMVPKIEPPVKLEEIEVEQAIEDYEKAQEEEKKAEEDIPEEQKLEKANQELLEKAIKGETTEEEKKVAQEYADKKTGDSLGNALEKQGSVKVSIIDENGNESEKEIKDLKNIKIITNTGKTEKEIKAEYDKAKKEGKELMVVDGKKVNKDTKTSVDFALTHGLDPFDKEALDKYVWGENEGSEGGETSIGDPPDYMPTDAKVIVDSKASAGKSIQKVTGTPGKKIYGTAMAKNKKVAYAKNKIMQANVLFSDMVADLSTTGEEIYIGSTTLDENGHGVIIPEQSIPDGEYYLIVGNEEGIDDISTLIINNNKAPKAPELELVETEEGLLPIITKLLTFIEKTTALNAQEFIAESQGTLAIEDKMILRGKADPGATVYVMYKSKIITSALLSDASQGEFELEIPSELEYGDHEVLAYIYDENNSMLGNITALLFNK